MSRMSWGILILLGFSAMVIYLAIGEFRVRCEVCMNFEGRTACDASVASDETSAQMQAVQSACSQISGGVSGIIACTSRAPASVKCEE